MSAFSTTARIMVRPFHTYAALARADEAHGRPTVVVGMARLAFVTGAFVAITATGRLAPFEIVSGMISFAYVPVLHFLSMTLVTRLFARAMSPKRAYALFAEGYGPWFLFMLAVAGGSLFANEPARLLSRTSAFLMLATFGWSGTLTYACFREALGLPRGRALAALLVHYLVLTALVLAFFLLAGQLLPILPR